MSNAELECIAEYEHNGKKWALDLFAESPEDAQAKIESIKASAVLLGVQNLSTEPNVELRGRAL